MEPLTSVLSSSTTTSDAHVLSSNTTDRDIMIIKNKLNILLNEHHIHQEWILLAHVVNRLCFIFFLFFFSYSIGNHFLHK